MVVVVIAVIVVIVIFIAVDAAAVIVLVNVIAAIIHHMKMDIFDVLCGVDRADSNGSGSGRRAIFAAMDQGAAAVALR